MRRRPAAPELLVDVDPPAEGLSYFDEVWVGRTTRHRELLESELLMGLPMRFSGCVEIFEGAERQCGGDGREVRADAITAPDATALELGTLMAKVIADRLENPRTLLSAMMACGLLFLVIGFVIGWLVS